MIRLRALLTGVVLGVALSFASDRAESMGSPGDEASLRALYGQLLDGWNRGSGTAFASVFDEHADLVGPGGFHIEGRDRIASFHQMLFDGLYRGTQLIGVVRSVRFVTDDVAVIHAIGGPTRTGDVDATLGRAYVHSMVAVRRNGTWLLEALHSTPLGWRRVDSAGQSADLP